MCGVYYCMAVKHGPSMGKTKRSWKPWKFGYEEEC